MAGFRDADLYPLKQPNMSAAKKLANGHTGDGTVVLYESNRGASPLRAQIIQYNLKQIGLNVDTHLLARAVQLEKEGTRGEPFDIADESWGADYADPYDFINVLLDGRNIQASNNNNFSYFNDPKFNKQMTQAALLSGSKRYTAYGNLDVAIMQQAVPWAPRSNANNRMFVVEAVRVLHLQRDLHGRPRGRLPQVGATREWGCHRLLCRRVGAAAPAPVRRAPC